MGLRIAWAAAALTLLGGCGGAVSEGVVAEVNGYKITLDELDRYYDSQIQDQSQEPSDDQRRMVLLNLLSEIIDRRMLLQRAERLGLLATEEEVEARFREFRAPFENEDEFLASLSERGVTREQLREEIRRAVSIEKLFAKEITSRVKVSEEEMREYYESNRGSFALAEQQLRLAQILVTPVAETPPPNLLGDDAVDEETARAKIRMLSERLASGEDFAALAERYSEDPDTASNGGDLGYVPQSALEKADLAVRRVVAALSPGEISPPIETEGGFRIIKLIEKEPAGQRDFSDPRVRESIRRSLANRKDQLLKAAFLEVVRSESSVRNHFARRLVESYGVGD